MDIKSIFRAGSYEIWMQQNPSLVDAVQRLIDGGAKRKTIIAFVVNKIGNKSMVSNTIQGAINYMFDKKDINSGKKKIKI